MFANPQCDWFSSRPSTVEIPPQGELVYSCSLIKTEYRTTGTGEINGLKIFAGTTKDLRGCPDFVLKADQVQWQSPVTFLGIFESAPSEHDLRMLSQLAEIPGRVTRPDWQGIIQSTPAELNLPE